MRKWMRPHCMPLADFQGFSDGRQRVSHPLGFLSATGRTRSRLTGGATTCFTHGPRRRAGRVGMTHTAVWCAGLKKPIISSGMEPTAERERAITIMTGTFDDNPAVWFSIGRGGNVDRRKRELAAFLYDYCHQRNGVYFSADRAGLLLAYSSDVRVPWWHTLQLEARLAVCAIGPFRFWRVLRRATRVKSLQRARGKHLHCWYIGVMTEYRTQATARELQHTLFAISDFTRLPVLAETTIPRNRNAFVFIGFQSYAEVIIGKMTTWLLERPPGPSN